MAIHKALLLAAAATGAIIAIKKNKAQKKAKVASTPASTSTEIRTQVNIYKYH
jgi:hypothetical protein